MENLERLMIFFVLNRRNLYHFYFETGNTSFTSIRHSGSISNRPNSEVWAMTTDGTNLYALIGNTSPISSTIYIAPRIYTTTVPRRSSARLIWTQSRGTVEELVVTDRNLNVLRPSLNVLRQDRRISLSIWNSKLVAHVGNTLYEYSTTDGSLQRTILLGGIYDFPGFTRTSPLPSYGMDITTSTIYIRSSSGYLDYVFSYPNIL